MGLDVLERLKEMQRRFSGFQGDSVRFHGLFMSVSRSLRVFQGHAMGSQGR